MDVKKVIKEKNKVKTKMNEVKTRRGRSKKVIVLKCFNEVHRRVVDGWSIDEIIGYIRDMGEWKDINMNYARILISEYRKTVPPGERVRSTLPGSYMQAIDELKVGINEINEMVELYKIQKHRIEIDYGEEIRLNKLFKGTGEEIKVAADIINQILEKKMDLGIIQRKIGRLDIASVNIDVEMQAKLDDKYGRTVVSRVLRNPESRQKLLSIVDYLSIVADKGKEEKNEFEKIVEDGIREKEEIVMKKKEKRGDMNWVQECKDEKEIVVGKRRRGNPNWVKGMMKGGKIKKEKNRLGKG